MFDFLLKTRNELLAKPEKSHPKKDAQDMLHVRFHVQSQSHYNLFDFQHSVVY